MIYEYIIRSANLAFHEDGYLIVEGLFDSEEADILRKAAHADTTFGDIAYGLEDGEGGKAQLVLWDKPGEDIWGSIAKSERIVDAMALVEAAYQSAAEHRAVELKEITGENKHEAGND